MILGGKFVELLFQASIVTAKSSVGNSSMLDPTCFSSRSCISSAAFLMSLLDVLDLGLTDCRRTFCQAKTLASAIIMESITTKSFN